MKMRIVILVVVIAALVTSSVVLAQSGKPSPPARSGSWAVERGAASGGGYRLTSLTWRASGAISGTNYRLLGPAAPVSSEKGCCCTYLPCVLR